MTSVSTSKARRSVAVFDLDGTLTWRDTLAPFLMSFLRRHPCRVWGLWRLPFALLSFAARHRDRGLLKSRVIRMVMSGASRTDVGTCADAFVNSLQARRRLRPAALAALEAHREAGDHLVLLSASPDLYVPRIGRALGFERTLCTEIEWRGDRLIGALKTANRRGAEKARCLDWLRTQYPGLAIVAYGNSASDLDHLRQADRALLVNGNPAARALAAQSGIPTSDWT
ncbi:MAG TPA: HAD family hydrolase [Steroidobacteraceae bacterium]|jgi:phosphatidylglycerophosphatase C|nr:HAD family hydrolase [Steroidobacteraceae bacterium]